MPAGGPPASARFNSEKTMARNLLQKGAALFGGERATPMLRQDGICMFSVKDIFEDAVALAYTVSWHGAPTAVFCATVNAQRWDRAARDQERAEAFRAALAAELPERIGEPEHIVMILNNSSFLPPRKISCQAAVSQFHLAEIPGRGTLHIFFEHEVLMLWHEGERRGDEPVLLGDTGSVVVQEIADALRRIHAEEGGIKFPSRLSFAGMPVLDPLAKFHRMQPGQCLEVVGASPLTGRASSIRECDQ